MVGAVLGVRHSNRLLHVLRKAHQGGSQLPRDSGRFPVFEGGPVWIAGAAHRIDISEVVRLGSLFSP